MKKIVIFLFLILSSFGVASATSYTVEGGFGVSRSGETSDEYMQVGSGAATSGMSVQLPPNHVLIEVGYGSDDQDYFQSVEYGHFQNNGGSFGIQVDGVIDKSCGQERRGIAGHLNSRGLSQAQPVESYPIKSNTNGSYSSFLTSFGFAASSTSGGSGDGACGNVSSGYPSQVCVHAVAIAYNPTTYQLISGSEQEVGNCGARGYTPSSRIRGLVRTNVAAGQFITGINQFNIGNDAKLQGVAGNRRAISAFTKDAKYTEPDMIPTSVAPFTDVSGKVRMQNTGTLPWVAEEEVASLPDGSVSSNASCNNFIPSRNATCTETKVYKSNSVRLQRIEKSGSSLVTPDDFYFYRVVSTTYGSVEVPPICDSPGGGGGDVILNFDSIKNFLLRTVFAAAPCAGLPSDWVSYVQSQTGSQSVGPGDSADFYVSLRLNKASGSDQLKVWVRDYFSNENFGDKVTIPVASNQAASPDFAIGCSVVGGGYAARQGYVDIAVNLNSLNGFSGVGQITTSVVPSGPSASSKAVNLISGQTINENIRVNINNALARSYQVTLTAVLGAVTKTCINTINVYDANVYVATPSKRMMQGDAIFANIDFTSPSQVSQLTLREVYFPINIECVNNPTFSIKIKNAFMKGASGGNLNFAPYYFKDSNGRIILDANNRPIQELVTGCANGGSRFERIYFYIDPSETDLLEYADNRILSWGFYSEVSQGGLLMSDTLVVSGVQPGFRPGKQVSVNPPSMVSGGASSAFDYTRVNHVKPLACQYYYIYPNNPSPGYTATGKVVTSVPGSIAVTSVPDASQQQVVNITGQVETWQFFLQCVNYMDEYFNTDIANMSLSPQAKGSVVVKYKLNNSELLPSSGAIFSVKENGVQITSQSTVPYTYNNALVGKSYSVDYVSGLPVGNSNIIFDRVESVNGNNLNTSGQVLEFIIHFKPSGAVGYTRSDCTIISANKGNIRKNQATRIQIAFQTTQTGGYSGPVSVSLASPTPSGATIESTVPASPRAGDNVTVNVLLPALAVGDKVVRLQFGGTGGTAYPAVCDNVVRVFDAYFTFIDPTTLTSLIKMRTDETRSGQVQLICEGDNVWQLSVGQAVAPTFSGVVAKYIDGGSEVATTTFTCGQTRLLKFYPTATPLRQSFNLVGNLYYTNQNIGAISGSGTLETSIAPSIALTADKTNVSIGRSVNFSWTLTGVDLTRPCALKRNGSLVATKNPPGSGHSIVFSSINNEGDYTLTCTDLSGGEVISNAIRVLLGSTINIRSNATGSFASVYTLEYNNASWVNALSAGNQLNSGQIPNQIFDVPRTTEYRFTHQSGVPAGFIAPPVVSYSTADRKPDATYALDILLTFSPVSIADFSLTCKSMQASPSTIQMTKGQSSNSVIEFTLNGLNGMSGPYTYKFINMPTGMVGVPIGGGSGTLPGGPTYSKTDYAYFSTRNANIGRHTVTLEVTLGAVKHTCPMTVTIHPPLVLDFTNAPVCSAISFQWIEPNINPKPNYRIYKNNVNSGSLITPVAGVSGTDFNYSVASSELAHYYLTTVVAVGVEYFESISYVSTVRPVSSNSCSAVPGPSGLTVGNLPSCNGFYVSFNDNVTSQVSKISIYRATNSNIDDYGAYSKIYEATPASFPKLAGVYRYEDTSGLDPVPTVYHYGVIFDYNTGDASSALDVDTTYGPVQLSATCNLDKDADLSSSNKVITAIDGRDVSPDAIYSACQNNITTQAINSPKIFPDKTTKIKFKIYICNKGNEDYVVSPANTITVIDRLVDMKLLTAPCLVLNGGNVCDAPSSAYSLTDISGGPFVSGGRDFRMTILAPSYKLPGTKTLPPSGGVWSVVFEAQVSPEVVSNQARGQFANKGCIYARFPSGPSSSGCNITTLKAENLWRNDSRASKYVSDFVTPFYPYKNNERDIEIEEVSPK